MKTSGEYRALAWKELRAQFKQVFIIMLATVILGMIAVSVLYGSIYWLTVSKSLIAALVTILLSIGVILTVGLLNYYIPVWFMTLVRKQQPWYEVHTGYGRAFLTAMLVILPTIVQNIVNFPMRVLTELAQNNTVIATIVAVSIIPYCLVLLAVLVFMIWWTYAVGHILPYRVYDHHERTAFQSIGDSIRMMKGHKFNLFCVDLKIAIWPYLIIFVLMFCFIFGMAFVMVYAVEYTVWAAVGMAVLALPLIAVLTFVVQPMLHIAHVLYYEDLRAEQEPAAPEAAQPTNVE